MLDEITRGCRSCSLSHTVCSFRLPREPHWATGFVQGSEKYLLASHSLREGDLRKQECHLSGHPFPLPSKVIGLSTHPEVRHSRHSFFTGPLSCSSDSTKTFWNNHASPRECPLCSRVTKSRYGFVHLTAMALV